MNQPEPVSYGLLRIILIGAGLTVLVGSIALMGAFK
jgi:hypothetical protein